MKKYFDQKYRIASNRLQGYDYSSDGAYFITGNTWNNIHYFGEIYPDAEDIILKDAGKIIEAEWYRTATMRKNVTLGAFQIMPNHFHGIIILGELNLPEEVEDAIHQIPQTPGYKNKFASPQKGTIGSILRGMKSTITSQIIHRVNPNFQWQNDFYDHIIRDMKSFRNITYYIENNVKNWKDDRFYTP